MFAVQMTGSVKVNVFGGGHGGGQQTNGRQRRNAERLAAFDARRWERGGLGRMYVWSAEGVRFSSANIRI